MVSYKRFIVNLIERDLRQRFSRSRLGLFWLLLNPMLTLGLYWIIFAQFFSSNLKGFEGNKYAFGVFLCSGLIPWMYFSESVVRISSCLTENSEFIKKTNIPHSTFIAACFGSVSLQYSIYMIAIILISLFSGLLDIENIWMLPLLISLQSAIALLLGYIIAVLNVFIRDLTPLMGNLFLYWFWLTPVVYPISSVSEGYRFLIMLNPMSELIVLYQNMLIFKIPPSDAAFTSMFTFMIILIALSILIQKALSSHLAEEI